MNFPGPIKPEWATYCEDRSPKFKIHQTKGHAFGALSDKRPNTAITVYRYDDSKNEWEIVVDFKPPENCENCKGSFTLTNKYGRVTSYKYIFSYNSNLSKWQLPIICQICYDTAYEVYRKQKEYERTKAAYEKAAADLGK